MWSARPRLVGRSCAASHLAPPRSNLRVIYEESPFHVIFEVTLIVFILYVVLFKRSYDPKKRCVVMPACSVAGQRPPLRRWH